MPWIERALALARLTGSADVESHALGYRGVGRCLAGDDAGLADLRTAVEIAQRIGHADYLTVAAQNTAVVLMRSGRVLEAEPYLDLADRTAVAHRLESAHFRIAAQQCYVALWRGDGTWPRPRLRELVDADVDAGANAVNPLAFLGRILARRGDPAAGRLIERAEKLAAACGEEQKLAVAVAATVEWRWLAGDADGVRGSGRAVPVDRRRRPAPAAARRGAAPPAAVRRAGRRRSTAASRRTPPVSGETGRPRRLCGWRPATRTSGPGNCAPHRTSSSSGKGWPSSTGWARRPRPR